MRILARLRRLWAWAWHGELLARSVMLYDDRGQIRVSLTATADGPALMMFTEQGQHRLCAQLLGGDPSVSFFDARGRLVLGIRADKFGALKADGLAAEGSVPAPEEPA